MFKLIRGICDKLEKKLVTGARHGLRHALAQRSSTDQVTDQVGLRFHLQQKPPDRHHPDRAEPHGDGFIGAPGDDGPLRHRQFDHGFGE